MVSLVSVVAVHKWISVGIHHGWACRQYNGVILLITIFLSSRPYPIAADHYQVVLQVERPLLYCPRMRYHRCILGILLPYAQVWRICPQRRCNFPRMHCTAAGQIYDIFVRVENRVNFAQWFKSRILSLYCINLLYFISHAPILNHVLHGPRKLIDPHTQHIIAQAAISSDHKVVLINRYTRINWYLQNSYRVIPTVVHYRTVLLLIFIIVLGWGYLVDSRGVDLMVLINVNGSHWYWWK